MRFRVTARTMRRERLGGPAGNEAWMSVALWTANPHWPWRSSDVWEWVYEGALWMEDV